MSREDAGTQVRGVVIRRAELEDVEVALGAVRELTEGSAMAAHWSRPALYPYLVRDEGSGALQARAMFVACANCDKDMVELGSKRIVGFAAFSAILTVGAGESTLENMAVAETWQRQGIGERLLAAGLLWCRAQASEAVFLEVRESNRAAIALYERAGFSLAGRRPGYYRNPAEDGLQMQKIFGLPPGSRENLSC